MSARPQGRRLGGESLGARYMGRLRKVIPQDTLHMDQSLFTRQDRVVRSVCSPALVGWWLACATADLN